VVESLRSKPSPAAFWLSSLKWKAPSPWATELHGGWFHPLLLEGVVAGHEGRNSSVEIPSFMKVFKERRFKEKRFK